MIESLRESLEYIPPGILKKILSGCLWEGTPESEGLALTFDDGPDPEVTPVVLDALEESGGKGTFFMVGERVKQHPHLAAEVRARGHAVGSHAHTHCRMVLMRKKDIVREIMEASEAIGDATGEEPSWFRPPYGVFNVACAREVRRRGMSMVLWTVSSGDYGDRSAERILGRVRPFIRPGAIHVFHDTVNGGGKALEDIVRAVGSAAAESGLRLGRINDLTFSKSMRVRRTHASERS